MHTAVLVIVPAGSAASPDDLPDAVDRVLTPFSVHVDVKAHRHYLSEEEVFRLIHDPGSLQQLVWDQLGDEWRVDPARGIYERCTCNHQGRYDGWLIGGRFQGELLTFSEELYVGTELSFTGQAFRVFTPELTPPDGAAAGVHAADGVRVAAWAREESLRLQVEWARERVRLAEETLAGLGDPFGPYGRLTAAACEALRKSGAGVFRPDLEKLCSKAGQREFLERAAEEVMLLRTEVVDGSGVWHDADEAAAVVAGAADDDWLVVVDCHS